jgi:phosphoenolpyruvate-protein phosphotransferase (PTS system enzyme I)
MTETPPSQPSDAPPAQGGEAPAGERGSGQVLRGTPVAPGLALGVVHRKDHQLARVTHERVPLDGVETELNRFHQALLAARAQLASLKEKLIGKVPVDDARILDVHVAYLKDSVFISDVENLISNEQLRLEAAIAKVISDFDRIFRLVQNETLRERAVDLRDVGIRVLRQLEQLADTPAEGGATPSDYVLVARELSIVDMFNLRGDRVLAILTEEGGLTSHAAVLARSMRIPTLTGLRGLLDAVSEGDFVIVDASEGLVRIDPDERVREQYREARSLLESETVSQVVPTWATAEPRTLDGEKVVVEALCGSLPEVEQAVALGMSAIGLYRTELLYLVDKEQPTRETLTRHYATVLSQARGAPVTFRLLQADSSLGLGWLHAAREPNPALGRAGVRALLAREEVLRRQIQALLRADVDKEARLLVPFVTDSGELRRVKEIVFEERLELRKSGEEHRERLALGVVLETPAALLGVQDLAKECDFLALALDSCLQHLLAADRENADLAGWFESLHPFVLRVLAETTRICDELGRPLSVFGYTATQPHNLPFLLGLGLRRFLVPPIGLREFLAEIGQVDARTARRATRQAMKSSCQAEMLSLVDGYRHGYAR